jgi:hypothetical protein
VPPAAPAAPAHAGQPTPSRAQLQALAEVVSLGYLRGVQRQLDDIETQRPDCAAWLAPLRTLAQAFQFDRMTSLIRDALAKTHSV